MLSVIICTRNRADILKYCLDSFIEQKDKGLYNFELLVVDNGSQDTTRELVQSYGNQLSSLRYILEPRVGLSQARNRGFQEANYEWVAYIDDDAKAYPDFISRIFFIIQHFNFDCFGGRFFPWYMAPKPAWLSNHFGLFPLLLPSVGELPATAHVAGGVMVVKKDVLHQVGGFPLTLGMSGDKIGYGEENWLQDELRKRNYTIGFDPELKIDHLVASYKYTLKWHLQRAYAKGVTEKIMNSKKSIIIRSFLLVRATSSMVYSLIRNLFRLTKSDYYIENYMLDSMSYFLKTLGTIL